MLSEKEKPQWTSIRSKVKKKNYLELEKYCKAKKITVSSYMRSLIEKNNPATVPIKKAGTNNFRFNPLEDKFIWEIDFDDGSKEVIAEELSDTFLENLKKSIDKALTTKKEEIDKRMEDSVNMPRLSKLEGRGENVKS